MLLPERINPEKAAEVGSLLSVYNTGLRLLGEDKGRKARYIRGGLTEYMVYQILSLIYPEQVEWQEEKTERQMYYGPDGKPDPGWDMETQGMRVDVKWDSSLSGGNVQLGLYRSNGYPQLLLSGKATTSAHVYLQGDALTAVDRHFNALQVKRGWKPKPGLVLKVLWIDLEALRADLVQVDGKWSLAGYKEETISTGDRTLTLPLRLIIEKYGRLDIIQS